MPDRAPFLELSLLGGLEVRRDGMIVPILASRKTRALLTYLALCPRRHRRERLCEMFWELPDDPRGALRWSLSKLRAVVDDAATTRLIADREHVALLPYSPGSRSSASWTKLVDIAPPPPAHRSRYRPW